MKKLHFDAPDGWDHTCTAGYEDMIDDGGEFVDSCYVERLVASNREKNRSFQAAVWRNCTPDAREQIEQEVIDYLSNSGFIMPEYILQSDNWIWECQIAGCKAYYYLIQKPKEEKAIIRIIFDDSCDRCTYIDAFVDDWRDEGAMINFLKERLSFIDE